MASKLEPYIGPRPFTSEDQEIFFGREREASELLSLVIAHSVSLVFGKPGTGKSSLINALLIPGLEREKVRVLPVAYCNSMIPIETELNASIKPIQDSNKQWLLAHSGTRQMSLRLETRADRWVRNGRLTDQLFNQLELLEAERWMKSPEAEEVGYSEPLFALMSASRAAAAETAQLTANEQARNIRRLRVLAVLLALVSLAALIATGLLLMR